MNLVMSHRRLLALLALLAASRSAAAQVRGSVSPTAARPARGLILAPGGHRALEPCAPGVMLTSVVDSAAAPDVRLLAALVEVRGRSNHRAVMAGDAVHYVISGWGESIVGADTMHLGPGSVLYVPPAQGYHLVSAGATALRLFVALRPYRADAPRSARAAFACGLAGSAGGPIGVPPLANPGDNPQAARVVTINPGQGERISYCVFPLTITAQIDSDAAPGARLTAATGALRRGTEAATHREDDEIVLVTHGRGRAFVEADTAAVEPGSVVFAPRGMRHGFTNEGAGTLEYFVVFSEPGPRDLFRRFAARLGPYCPAETP